MEQDGLAVELGGVLELMGLPGLIRAFCDLIKAGGRFGLAF